MSEETNVQAGDTGNATDTNAPVNDAADKVDIEKVNPEDLPEDTRKIVKGFQAEYTRSKQALKETETKLKEREAKVQEWEKWSTENAQNIEAYNRWIKEQAEAEASSGDVDDVDDTDDPVYVDPKRAKKIADEAARRNNQELDAKYDTVAKRLMAQQKVIASLMKLQKANPDIDIDADRIMEFSEKTGIYDPQKAFEGAYSEELVDIKVKRAVEEAKKEWQSKDTNVLSPMPGRTVRKVIARDRK